MRHPITSSSSQPNIIRSDTTNKKSKTTPCCAKVGVKRGPWTSEEDQILCEYIKKEGSVGRWRTLPKRAGLSRCGKSCRLRWMNYLRPSVKRGHIDVHEEDLILRLHRLLGNRWSLIAGRIPGRTDNEIKNYWNTHLSKKLISQGIDPRTHKPLDPINNPPSNDKPSTSSNPNHSQNPNPKIAAPPSLNDTFIPSQFNEEYGYYHDGTDIDHYQGLAMQSSDVIRNEENEEDDINNCTDDVFSSFLNSLINEDVYGNYQNQMQEQQLISADNMIRRESTSDALISLPQMGFAFGAGWDAPIMSRVELYIRVLFYLLSSKKFPLRIEFPHFFIDNMILSNPKISTLKGLSNEICRPIDDCLSPSAYISTQ